MHEEPAIVFCSIGTFGGSANLISPITFPAVPQVQTSGYRQSKLPSRTFAKLYWGYDGIIIIIETRLT